ncbi:AMSH-like ubiquitin thioesterase 3 [Eucalyptus grandis]|uniref:AMSH-like ubiquitin thioesterase 3 n=1 Tax=Eucalyptus grandis TaxID=71139 RepID=UPI00192EA190|nr:AMSH-like ubiquitin thioesterase 3 [Eucalyptus grandis]
MKIDVNSIARRVEVDSRVPLHDYYRTADNLLKQANVYREENNIVDLFIILLRFSSLVSETIPFHRDYRLWCPKERSTYRKQKVCDVLDELESLKPEFQCRVDELEEADAGSQMLEFDNSDRNAYASRTFPLEWPSTSRSSYSSTDKKVKEGFSDPDSLASSSLWKYQNDQTQSSLLNTMQVDKQFQKPCSCCGSMAKSSNPTKGAVQDTNGKRKKRWEELRPYKRVTPNVRNRVQREEQDRIASLKPEFGETKRDILMRTELPSFNTGCSAIKNEETRKRAVAADSKVKASVNLLTNSAPYTTSNFFLWLFVFCGFFFFPAH